MMLRTATGRDVDAIARIMGDWCAATPYIPPLHSRQDDRRFIRRVVADQNVMVAEQNGILQGFIARDGTQIGQLYLAPAARGQGIGAALLDHMKSCSVSLELWCFQANTDARRFYERHGFVVGKLTDGEGNEERLPDVHYVWSSAQ